MKTIKYIVTVIALVISMTIVAVVAVLINPKLGAIAIKTFTDEPYEVIIYGYSLPSFAMPGQGGDRDGFARVYNTASGRLLCEVDVPQAGHIYENDVRWWGSSVSLPGNEGFQDCPLY
jgi:hypothetical protein